VAGAEQGVCGGRIGELASHVVQNPGARAWAECSREGIGRHVGNSVQFQLTALRAHSTSSGPRTHPAM
jgi:hypothetical protein